ncbi:DUF4040 domain-containing protein [Calothrix sp. UHCC 0171]|uniref:DUF4040 domain-containing protein n=1 Tax=Calothrix sp. UHCC 0171 TaxID=3110245 RepID=UPI002B2161A9|nr:DUF4040 domain-containing protein [Calothrix sp. UHCC 0171]MEA5574117.1 DUF4040 domain-containing protein [Calothrix sp. UHCC 0171]
MTDSYVYVITALLPLVASMLIFQVNPYHALVIRGILGAVAALVYTILGAADVALTEALVGTLLAITLYAVAVRSSMVLRLGVLKEAIAPQRSDFKQLMDELRSIFSKYHMQVELVPYLNEEDLQQALIEKEIHATCALVLEDDEQVQTYQMTTRLRRLYEIMHSGLASTTTQLTYFSGSNSREKHL